MKGGKGMSKYDEFDLDIQYEGSQGSPRIITPTCTAVVCQLILASIDYCEYISQITDCVSKNPVNCSKTGYSTCQICGSSSVGREVRC